MVEEVSAFEVTAVAVTFFVVLTATVEAVGVADDAFAEEVTSVFSEAASVFAGAVVSGTVVVGFAVVEGFVVAVGLTVVAAVVFSVVGFVVDGAVVDGAVVVLPFAVASTSLG